MKLAACFITLIAFICNWSHAQFHVSYSPKDAFSSALIKVLNEAPNNFESLKRKKLPGADSLSQVYANKVKLPQANDASIIIAGETVVACYSLGTFDKFSDAEASLVKTTRDISTGLKQQVLIRNTDSTEVREIARQTDIAFVTTNGFYDYNISLAIKKDSGYHVILNIHGGDPRFYYSIPSMPIRSGYFNAGFLNNTKAFVNNALFECNGDIPGFNCNTIKDSSFTALVQYVKYDDSEPHAFFEFDNALANIKSSLGKDYVYYFSTRSDALLKRATFIKRNDVEKLSRKSIVLKLTRADTELYELAIDFTPANNNDKTYAIEH